MLIEHCEVQQGAIAGHVSAVLFHIIINYVIYVMPHTALLSNIGFVLHNQMWRTRHGIIPMKLSAIYHALWSPSLFMQSLYASPQYRITVIYILVYIWIKHWMCTNMYPQDASVLTVWLSWETDV